MKKRIYLTLSDGSVWPGYGHIEAPVEGEVVFTTASCGYPQTLTDPSYNGQIVVFAFPPIGIYGVDKENLEGRRVWARAALMTCLDETEEGRFESLSSWMAGNGRPLVSDIDTRQLILKIRECGSMMGRIDVEPHAPEINELPHTLVAEVSCREREICGEGELTVALMDYGVKENIIRGMVRRGCRVIRFPNNAAAAEVLASGADGILLSNGPGDPAVLDFEAEEIAKMLGTKPILGVCLGNQLLARACGAKTKKLPFGHRGANQPVVECATGRGLLTSQNHQYAVDGYTLAGTDLEVAYSHLGDGTVEGLRHIRFDALSVQFHPEASPGPEDASYIFDNFVIRMQAAKGR
ncbi:MAG: glutamine-hydrolyzing carbamoyl-phosphate synthase small subunit [Synergistaceae bacterium]|nr:glutamine-hydrolyzing carbamoyl-phosphate synthase small subunit [Synergistaceae bacterium]